MIHSAQNPPVCRDHGPMVLAKSANGEDYWYCSVTSQTNHTLQVDNELAGRVCTSCGEPATRWCPAKNGMQCGAPLCDNCQHKGSIVSFTHGRKFGNADVRSRSPEFSNSIDHE